MPGWTIAIISIFVSITILLFFIEILGKIRINNKVNDFINQGIEYSAEEFFKNV